MKDEKEPKGPLDYQVGGDHYRRYKYQPIELIQDLGLGFERGNAIKYLARLGHKGDPLEDIQKIRHYLKFFEERLDHMQRKLLEFLDQIDDASVAMCIGAIYAGNLTQARKMLDWLEAQYKADKKAKR